MAGANEEDRERQRSEHEDHRRPSGEAREHVRSSAGTKRGLGSLTAECACEVGRATLLQQNDADKKEADDDVQDNDQVEENLHC